jgi:hypothetical protein
MFGMYQLVVELAEIRVDEREHLFLCGDELWSDSSVLQAFSSSTNKFIIRKRTTASKIYGHKK